jgi:hypothetical protein
MVRDREVRPEGCICEPCSDISTSWKDMRSGFGYTTLGEIALLLFMLSHSIATAGDFQRE